MREAFLAKLGASESISKELYSERVIPTADDSQKRFISSTAKPVDDLDFVAHASKVKKEVSTGIISSYADPLGMEKNGISIALDGLMGGPKVSSKPDDTRNRIIELTKDRDISKPAKSIPPIIRHGAPDEFERVSPLSLATIYAKDGMSHNWINRLVEYFLSAEPSLKSPSNHAKDQTKLDDWSDKTGFRSLIKAHFQHKYNYGNSIWRWIPDENGELMYLDPINPLYFDAVRDEIGRVKYDHKTGEPVAYVQYLRSDDDVSIYPIDRLINQTALYNYQSGMGVLFWPNEIIHTRLNQVGDDWWGIGPIEAGYVDIINKKNGDQGAAESIQSAGYPRIVGYQGDKEHPPTPQKMEDLISAIDDLKADSQVAVPHYNKMEVLESRMSNIDTMLKYLTDNAVTSLGGPKALVTGTGQDTNRSTLSSQMAWLERSLKMEQQDASDELREPLMVRLKEKLGLTEVPILAWQEVSLESIEGRTERLAELAKNNLINPMDPKMIKYVADLMEIPVTRFKEATPVKVVAKGSDKDEDEPLTSKLDKSDKED